MSFIQWRADRRQSLLLDQNMNASKPQGVGARKQALMGFGVESEVGKVDISGQITAMMAPVTAALQNLTSEFKKNKGTAPQTPGGGGSQTFTGGSQPTQQLVSGGGGVTQQHQVTNGGNVGSQFVQGTGANTKPPPKQVLVAIEKTNQTVLENFSKFLRGEPLPTNLGFLDGQNNPMRAMDPYPQANTLVTHPDIHVDRRPEIIYFQLHQHGCSVCLWLLNSFGTRCMVLLPHLIGTTQGYFPGSSCIFCPNLLRVDPAIKRREMVIKTGNTCTKCLRRYRGIKCNFCLNRQPKVCTDCKFHYSMGSCSGCVQRTNRDITAYNALFQKSCQPSEKNLVPISTPDQRIFNTAILLANVIPDSSDQAPKVSPKTTNSTDQSSVCPDPPTQVPDTPVQSGLAEQSSNSSSSATEGSLSQPSLETKVIKFLDEKAHKGLQAARNMTEKEPVVDAIGDKAGLEQLKVKVAQAQGQGVTQALGFRTLTFQQAVESNLVQQKVGASPAFFYVNINTGGQTLSGIIDTGSSALVVTPPCVSGRSPGFLSIPRGSRLV